MDYLGAEGTMEELQAAISSLERMDDPRGGSKMCKYLAVISTILLGCSLDGSSWEAILAMTAISIMLTFMALVEEAVKSERLSHPSHSARMGQKGTRRRIEDSRELRVA